MYKFFGYVNEVESHNKSRQYDLALETFWATQYGWLRLCTTVAMGMAITNCWKLFRYGVKRDHYGKLVGIREFSERLALDCFNNTISTDTGGWKRPYLSLMTLMMDIQFLLAMHFFFPVLSLVPQMPEIFLTLLSTVLHCHPILRWLILLDLSILL